MDHCARPSALDHRCSGVGSRVSSATLGLAFAEIVVLWLSIVATIVLFARHSRPAAALLVPYLVWVSYASALNLAIWLLN